MSKPSFLSALLPLRPRASIRVSSPSPHSSTTSLHSFPFSSPLSCPHQAPPQKNHPPPCRTFTTSSPLLKKSGGKQASKRVINASSETATNENADPMDFSAFEREIEKIVEGLRDEVRRIRPGGLSVEDVENVKVTLKKANDKGQKMVVKVGEMAQVVARGRTMVVLVGEKEHTKPLLTALSSSPLSINPLPPSPTTPFELHIPIPPTTTESRQTAIAQVSAKGEKALFALREARGAEKKRLNALKLGKKVGPDMLRRGEKELERVNEKGVGEVKKVVEGGRRGLGDGGG